MNAKTLRALKGSIKKWEDIVAGTGVDLGIANCPLCVEFIEDECRGCPVSATGEKFCRGTPYISWCEAHLAAGRYPTGAVVHDDESIIAATLELVFLRSLLPTKEGK